MPHGGVAPKVRRPFAGAPLARRGHVEVCADCGLVRNAFNSCRDRHCPKCQATAAQKWLEARQAELLPVRYFHTVFTLPEQLGAIAYQNKAVVYGLLFKAAAETLETIAADPKRLGARIGFTAVLHTWGQSLTHHPHLHCVIPGGGISLDGNHWVHCRRNLLALRDQTSIAHFFLPVRVLSRLLRRLSGRSKQTTVPAALSQWPPRRIRGRRAGILRHPAASR
jgi:hypothetical protein